MNQLDNRLEGVSKLCFGLALFIELSLMLLEKSDYTIQYEGLWFRLTFVLFSVSFITTKHSIREWVALFVMGIVGLISYRVTGRNEILRFVIFIWACQGKDVKQALKCSFWYTLIGSIGIILLSTFHIFGTIYVVDEFRKGMGEELRYCLGMGHPNSLHCMILVITLLGLYCYAEQLKWYHFMLLVGIHGLTYYLTDSRIGLLMSIGTISLFAVFKYVKVLRRWRGSYILGCLLIIACLIFCTICAKYSIDSPRLMKLDAYTNGRIWGLYETKNHEGMLHTWSLWSVARNNYYFDMGIVRVFYWFGIIPAIIYFGAQLRLLWCAMKKNDYAVLAVVIVITLYSVVEAHFISDYMARNYLLFFFGMYLKEMLFICEEEE